jgi:HlyD family secretion protein
METNQRILEKSLSGTDQSGMDRKIPKKRFTTKKILWMAGILIFIILLFFVYRISEKKVYNISRDRITVGTVTHGDFQDVILQSATVEPLTTVILNSPIGGLVQKMFVEDGSMVKAGESLLKLSNPDATLGYITSEGQIIERINDLRKTRLDLETNQRELEQQMLQTNTDLDEAATQFKRDTTLYIKGIVSQKDYQTSRRNYHLQLQKKALMAQTMDQEKEVRQMQLNETNASIARLQKSLGIIQQSIENLTVKAPVSGRLSSFDPVVGKSYAPNETMGKIDVLQGYKLVAQVDEYYISRVHEGQKAVCIFGDTEYPMEVKKVLPEVTNGQFETDLVFTGKTPQGVSRGLSLQVKIFLSANQQALLLPRGQFFESTGGNWVYVVKGEHAVKRNIQLGRKNYQYFEVLDGLEKGDSVITSSYDGYTQYDEVNIK